LYVEVSDLAVEIWALAVGTARRPVRGRRSTPTPMPVVDAGAAAGVVLARECQPMARCKLLLDVRRRELSLGAGDI